ncbi:hypothetical protein Van01_38250 [Micromonospora andamanensis]|uniref:Uncharacterized protein n=1 Tax=Micromonospora andamanensis TaxID=1287068 RepID=A0ABQ4HYK9_9ACTN|nr:hypothetical protein Van01_38250 [Micromonospora andamanensis]
MRDKCRPDGTHPIYGGRPPIPDGDRYPIPAPPQLVARSQLVAGWIAAGIVLVMLVAGIAGCIP